VKVKRPGYVYEAMTNPHSKLMMTYRPCTPYKLIFCCVRCEDIWGVCVRVCTGGKRVWGDVRAGCEGVGGCEVGGEGV